MSRVETIKVTGLSLGDGGYEENHTRAVGFLERVIADCSGTSYDLTLYDARYSGDSTANYGTFPGTGLSIFYPRVQCVGVSGTTAEAAGGSKFDKIALNNKIGFAANNIVTGSELTVRAEFWTG